MAETISAFGKIDTVVANAGIWFAGSVLGALRRWLGADDLDEPHRCLEEAKAVAPHMIERRSGSIVMISAMDGKEAGDHDAHYSPPSMGFWG